MLSMVWFNHFHHEVIHDEIQFPERLYNNAYWPASLQCLVQVCVGRGFLGHQFMSNRKCVCRGITFKNVELLHDFVGRHHGGQIASLLLVNSAACTSGTVTSSCTRIHLILASPTLWSSSSLVAIPIFSRPPLHQQLVVLVHHKLPLSYPFSIQ